MSATPALRAKFYQPQVKQRNRVGSEPQHRDGRQPLHVKRHVTHALQTGTRLLHVTLSDGTLIEAASVPAGIVEIIVLHNGKDPMRRCDKLGLAQGLIDKHRVWLTVV